MVSVGQVIWMAMRSALLQQITKGKSYRGWGVVTTRGMQEAHPALTRNLGVELFAKLNLLWGRIVKEGEKGAVEEYAHWRVSEPVSDDELLADFFGKVGARPAFAKAGRACNIAHRCCARRSRTALRVRRGRWRAATCW